MSVAVAVKDPATFARFASILRSSEMTAIVETRNSHYTVIARAAFGVRVINEATGRVQAGDKVEIVDGYMVMYDSTGRVHFETSTVKAIHILTN